MTVTYLPLIGDGMTGGAGGPLASIANVGGAAIARVANAGIAAAGRPGSLRTSLLLLMTSFAAEIGTGQRLLLDIPPGILPAPSALAAITADAPYDYSQVLPMCSAQLVAAGTTVAFPTTTAAGSFLFGRANSAATYAILPSIGVTGLIVPASGTPYGQAQVDFFANVSSGLTGYGAPAMAMFQLTVDWGASIAN